MVANCRILTTEIFISYFSEDSIKNAADTYLYFVISILLYFSLILFSQGPRRRILAQFLPIPFNRHQIIPQIHSQVLHTTKTLSIHWIRVTCKMLFHFLDLVSAVEF